MSIRLHTARIAGASLVLMSLALAVLAGQVSAGRDPHPPPVQPAPEQPQHVKLPTISIDDIRVREPKRLREAFFNVTLSEPSNGYVYVYYTSVGGSATAGRDYRSTSGTLAFSPGETSKRLPVLVLGDKKREPAETFQVVLSNVRGAEILDGVGEATIVRADPCVCDTFRVNLVNRVDYVRALNDEVHTYTLLRLRLHYQMTCTKGDPSNCKGRYQLRYAEGPRNSGTHIRPEDKHDYVCLSPTCDQRSGENEFMVRIKNEAVLGRVATITIHVRTWCLTGADTSPKDKKLKLVLVNGELNAAASDLDGNGQADG
jgi:hypothetical protein